ncbi:MAG: T9SS type A sorting domain-containing protein [Bacteroidia bacterium]
MKKSLLTIFGAVALMVGFAQQTPSPSWTTTNNANFPIGSFGIRYMDACSAQDVYASGYHGVTGEIGRNYVWVTRTHDGGSNWTASPVWTSTATPAIGDTNYYVIANIDGIDANTAWVGAYTKTGGGSLGGIFKTTDGGATWNDMTSASMYTNAASFCNYVFFLTPNIGITAGDPVGGEFEMWRTTDGGANWTAVPGANIPNPVGGEFGIVNVYETEGTSNIWLGTNKGRILRSTDAGQTWSVSTVIANNTVSDIAFYDSMHGIVATYPPSSTVVAVYNTTDGGATWNALPAVTADPNYGRNDFCAIPGTCWYASCGAGQGNTLLSFSMDNGATWNDWGSVGIQYLAIDMFDHQTGWAGSFSDMSNPASEGFFKYSGASLQQAPSANMTIPSVGCVSVGITFTNQSTGNPCPTFAWSSNPAANFSSASAETPTVSFDSPGIYTITLQATNSLTSSIVTRTIDVQACTGINEIDNSVFNFIVSPNPSADIFNLTMPYSNEAYNITVTNVLGSVVYKESVNAANGRHSINMTENEAGVYFITIENKGNRTTKKVVLQ